MSIEGDLIGQARVQTQQTAEITRRQKEADQTSRQLFADCAETIDRYGTRIRTADGIDRALSLGVHLPISLLFHRGRLSPADALDHKRIAGKIDSHGTPLWIKMEADTAIPQKADSVTIKMQGINHRLVLNRHLGYGEIYSNDPNKNIPSQYRRRANIYDVTSYRQAAESMRDFVRTEPVPLPADIQRYGQMTDEALAKELKRAQRSESLNIDAGMLGIIAFTLGLIAAAEARVGSQEFVYGWMGLYMAGAITTLRRRRVLEHNLQVVQDEIASRR